MGGEGVALKYVCLGGYPTLTRPEDVWVHFGGSAMYMERPGQSAVTVPLGSVRRVSLDGFGARSLGKAGLYARRVASNGRLSLLIRSYGPTVYTIVFEAKPPHEKYASLSSRLGVAKADVQSASASDGEKPEVTGRNAGN